MPLYWGKRLGLGMKKKCSECGSEFNTPSGNRHTCSTKCYKIYWAKKKQSPESKARREQWKLSKGRYAQLKSRIKRKGFSYIMSEDNYFKIVRENCYYCGFKHWGAEKGVGLDRLDNTLEYIESNVVSCCGNCNRSRADIHNPEVFKSMMGGIDERALKALNLINAKQSTKRTLDEFIDYVLDKFDD